MSDAADRTIPATPRRRESARRLGFMPLSSLPAWVATVATTLLLLPAWAEATFEAATTMMGQALSDAANYPNSDGTVPSPRLDVLLPASLLLPTLAVVGVAAVVALAVRILLDGFTWQPGRLAGGAGPHLLALHAHVDRGPRVWPGLHDHGRQPLGQATDHGPRFG